jgi:rhodanese-related sulfurtransferase
VAVQEITVDELAERRTSGRVLIDVRRPDEYVEGHVPGALLVPLDEVPDRVEELRTLAPLDVICRTGSRSLRAAEYLETMGIEATNVVGGTLAWVIEGHSVSVGVQPE